MKNWILALIILCFVGVGFAFSQVEKNVGCVYHMKSDGRLHCDIGDMEYDDTNNRFKVDELDVTTAAKFFYAGTAVTSTAAEFNYLDIATLGTGAASKAVVLDAGDDYTWPSAGVLTYGVLNDATTNLNATAAEINQHADVSAMSELHSDNDTLTAADCGRTMFQGTDAKVFTLPATIAGCKLTFVNVGAATNNNVRVDPNAADYIGGTITLAASVVDIGVDDGEYVDNTKGTSVPGDSLTIVGDGVGGWFVTASTGIWASE
jgi:hypothetical protein